VEERCQEMHEKIGGKDNEEAVQGHSSSAQ